MTYAPCELCGRARELQTITPELESDFRARGGVVRRELQGWFGKKLCAPCVGLLIGSVGVERARLRVGFVLAGLLVVLFVWRFL